MVLKSPERQMKGFFPAEVTAGIQAWRSVDKAE
jgi:hypothetical protein